MTDRSENNYGEDEISICGQTFALKDTEGSFLSALPINKNKMVKRSLQI